MAQRYLSSLITYKTDLPKIGCSGFMGLAVTSWTDRVPARIAFGEKAK